MTYGKGKRNMSKALLVIDTQEAYVGERCASYLKYDKPALLRL